MLRTSVPGEDGITKPGPQPVAGARAYEGEEVDRAERGFALEQEEDAYDDEGLDFDEKPSDQEFLQMVTEADAQALQYVTQVNRQSWERGYRAYHQEHYDGSKYKSSDYNNRSKLFVPKTRTSVRKDMAATAASLFGSMDAVSTSAGNEGDPEQRASAAVLKELVNYRTDRKSTKASIPWFHTAMGSRQTSLITGICLSKQYWKLELRRAGQEEFEDEETGETGLRDVWKPFIDRPECELIPPENFVMDPAANWTNPAQDAAYLIIKYPMRIDEIRRRQHDPRNPWKRLDDSVLKAAGEGAQMAAEAIRRSREQGIDRFDKSQTTTHFDVIWVWESFVRTSGDDWTFISIGDKHMLTDPKPVEEVYPEQFGERPLTLGYGSLEAFRIFPMSNVESWQMLQQETNDIRNLSLDALKQNIMPVTKVVRGRNVDLDQLRRRSSGSAIMVQNKDDVSWEKAPDLSAGVEALARKIDIEFDDLSGTQNYNSIGNNNAVGDTLGGLKLAAGTANAVQEFDIRIWIETWCEPALAQIVRLEQFYESDEEILGICGERAKLMQKFGISEISDQLLENTVTVSVNVGLGAGDPQQRLQKFASAMQVAGPILAQSPDFAKGKVTIDWEAIMEEVFGAAGYRDGGKRFVKPGEPQQQDPMQEPAIAKLMSETEKNKALAKKAIVDSLVAAAEVGLQINQQQIEQLRLAFDLHHDHVEQLGRSQDMGHKHGLALQAAKMASKGLNPDGTPMLPPGASPPGAGGMGEGGGSNDAAAGVAAGGDVAPPPVNSDPAASAIGFGQDMLGTMADGSAPAPVEEAPPAGKPPAEPAKKKKKPKRVSIKARDKDGRASDFEIHDDED
jgi:hypothetical protein